MRGFLILIALAAMATAATPPARANAIDGQWCHNDGRRMSINGSELVTPNGARIQGNAGGTSFRYAAPGGRSVNMSMQGGNQVNVTQCYTPPETWRRCQDVVS